MPLLYVHVPFCIKKCAYCAFYSEALVSAQGKSCAGALMDKYLDALEKEVFLRRGGASEGVSSLFIGGGTPTALDVERLKRLLGILGHGFKISHRSEQTVEGNPGTLTAEKLKLLRRQGINRFSLGVQSFDDALLKRIGRIHSGAQAKEAFHMVRDSGFENINLDLMFGLPGQTVDQWRESIEEGIALAPEHFSLYGLNLEEGTPLAEVYKVQEAAVEEIEGTWADSSQVIETIVLEPRKVLIEELPDDDTQAEMYEWAVERLAKAGYRHYETSNFARPGYECRHNLGYWQGIDYLGLGPGAVSCLKNIRWKNQEDIGKYAKYLDAGKLPIDKEEYEELTLRERMTEALILGLRLADGVDLVSFKRKFGMDVRDIYGEVLERYERQGILYVRNGNLKLDSRYWFVANAILQEFV